MQGEEGVDNATLTHEKNSMYEGSFSKENRREGFGIAMLDDSSVIIGKFKSDQLVETCLLYLNLNTYFLGNFNKGALDGNFVIRSPKLSVYSSITNNKVNGRLVVIDYQKYIAQLWEIEGGKGQICKQILIGGWKNNRIEGEKEILQQISPHIGFIPSATQYIKQRKQVFDWRVDKNRIWIKLLSSKQIHFLTFCINHSEQIVSYGVGAYTGQNYNFMLDGLGYLFDQKSTTIFEGQFIANKLNGEGRKETLRNNRTIYGRFDDGEVQKVLTEDQKEITKRISLLKRSIHLHSLQFSNNYVNQKPLYILRNLMKIITEDH